MAAGARAIVTVELGAAPLECYHAGAGKPSVRCLQGLREIDEVGYQPLRALAGRAPAGGFRLLERVDFDGLIIYRFVSKRPQEVPERILRDRGLTVARTEVLVPSGALPTVGTVP